MANNSGKGSSVLGWIIALVVIALAGYGITNLTRSINENNNNQKEADISLNDYVKLGKDFPVGKYVSLDVDLVDGPYATYTTTETTNFLSATSSEDNYYYAYLDDGTVMSICTSNKNEKEKLNRLAALTYEQSKARNESIHLLGDLKELTAKDSKGNEVKQFFKNGLIGAGISASRMRTLVLDTRAGRPNYLLYILIGVAALILIVWLSNRSKKKKAAAAAAAAAQYSAPPQNY